MQLRDALTEARGGEVLELLHVALSKKRNAPHSIQGMVRESIQKHIAKRSLIKGAACRRARRSSSSAALRPFAARQAVGRDAVADAVADEWARIDRKYRCGPCHEKL